MLGQEGIKAAPLGNVDPQKVTFTDAEKRREQRARLLLGSCDDRAHQLATTKGAQSGKGLDLVSFAVNQNAALAEQCSDEPGALHAGGRSVQCGQLTDVVLARPDLWQATRRRSGQTLLLKHLA